VCFETKMYALSVDFGWNKVPSIYLNRNL